MKNTVIRKDIILILTLLVILPAISAAEDMPSMEFLEFLGEWETEEGDWIDPGTLVDTEIAESNEVDYVYTAEEQNNEQ